MFVKSDGRKDGSTYRFRVDYGSIDSMAWECLRWTHAFFLVIESHYSCLDQNSKFIRNGNILQVKNKASQARPERKTSKTFTPQSSSSLSSSPQIKDTGPRKKPDYWKENTSAPIKGVHLSELVLENKNGELEESMYVEDIGRPSQPISWILH